MLYPNGMRVLAASPRAIAGALATTGAFYLGGIRGARFNRFVSETHDPLSSIPSGYNAKAFGPPLQAGGMSAKAAVQVDASGDGAMGLGAGGTATLSINAAAIGELIMGGSGSATISLTATGSIVATIGSTGTATLALGGVASPGAIGWLEGHAPIALNGTLIAYAIGHMSGTTEESGLTPAGIANTVWRTLINGTEASSLLATAGSGGVDYDTLWASMPASLKQSLAEFVLAAAQVEPIHSTTQNAAAVADAVWAKELP